MSASGPERLSRLLFEAREQIDMWADVVVRVSGRLDAADEPRRIRDEIDAYRAERGWSPDGFGGEGKPSEVMAYLVQSRCEHPSFVDLYLGGVHSLACTVCGIDSHDAQRQAEQRESKR